MGTDEMNWIVQLLATYVVVSAAIGFGVIALDIGFNGNLINENLAGKLVPVFLLPPFLIIISAVAIFGIVKIWR